MVVGAVQVTNQSNQESKTTMNIDEKVSAAWKIAFEYFLKKQLESNESLDNDVRGCNAATWADEVAMGVIQYHIDDSAGGESSIEERLQDAKRKIQINRIG